MNNLSNRAKTALSHLTSGGYFRKQLETGFQGREQFQTRLRDSKGNVIKGIGIKAFYELKDAGLLQYRPCPSSSVWPEEFVLNPDSATG